MYRVKNTPVTSGSQCKDGSTVRLLDRQPSDYPDFATSPHPHGLYTFRHRYPVRYRDDITDIIPGGVCLDSGSTWPRVFHLNRRLRRALEQSGLSL